MICRYAGQISTVLGPSGQASENLLRPLISGSSPGAKRFVFCQALVPKSHGGYKGWAGSVMGYPRPNQTVPIHLGWSLNGGYYSCMCQLSASQCSNRHSKCNNQCSSRHSKFSSLTAPSNKVSLCNLKIYLFRFILFFVLHHVQHPGLYTSWSTFCTVNHWASTNNYQLSNMKWPGQDSNWSKVRAL